MATHHLAMVKTRVRFPVSARDGAATAAGSKRRAHLTRERHVSGGPEGRSRACTTPSPAHALVVEAR